MLFARDEGGRSYCFTRAAVDALRLESSGRARSRWMAWLRWMRTQPSFLQTRMRSPSWRMSLRGLAPRRRNTVSPGMRRRSEVEDIAGGREDIPGGEGGQMAGNGEMHFWLRRGAGGSKGGRGVRRGGGGAHGTPLRGDRRRGRGGVSKRPEKITGEVKFGTRWAGGAGQEIETGDLAGRTERFERRKSGHAVEGGDRAETAKIGARWAVGRRRLLFCWALSR